MKSQVRLFNCNPGWSAVRALTQIYLYAITGTTFRVSKVGTGLNLDLSCLKQSTTPLSELCSVVDQTMELESFWALPLGGRTQLKTRQNLLISRVFLTLCQLYSLFLVKSMLLYSNLGFKWQFSKMPSLNKSKQDFLCSQPWTSFWCCWS